MMGAILFKWVCVSGSGPVPRLWPAQALPPPPTHSSVHPSICVSMEQMLMYSRHVLGPPMEEE